MVKRKDSEEIPKEELRAYWAGYAKGYETAIRTLTELFMEARR